MQQSRETAARSRVTGAPAAAVGPRSRNGRRTERVAGRREASGRRRRTFLDDNYFDWPASRPAGGEKSLPHVVTSPITQVLFLLLGVGLMVLIKCCRRRGSPGMECSAVKSDLVKVLICIVSSWKASSF